MYCLVGKKEDKVHNNVLNIRVLFTLFFFFFLSFLLGLFHLLCGIYRYHQYGFVKKNM